MFRKLINNLVSFLLILLMDRKAYMDINIFKWKEYFHICVCKNGQSNLGQTLL